MLNNFLQCMPLKHGVIIIGSFGLIYGLLGLFFFFSMCIHYSQWLQHYKDRLDFCIYLYCVSFSTIALFVSGLFLFWALSTNEDVPFIVAIYCIGVHISIHWLAIIGLFIYCLFVPSCFQNQGPGYVVVLGVITAFYSVAWGYAMWIINSYRYII